MSRPFVLAVATLIYGLFSPGFSACSADWSRFRGPQGSGISADEAPTPVHWNESANLKWKCELPGPGSSSPIVVGDRVFVTSWSGYGVSRENPGNQRDLRRHLTCIDSNHGDIIWNKTVSPYLPEDEYGGMFAEHGYASHTPVSDGENVYVFFGKSGALAFDMEGNQLWQTSVGRGSDPRDWESASSPILFENLLIVTASAESQALVALDKSTGEEVWRQEASGLGGLWGTPILIEVNDSRTDLVIAVPGEVWGLNPNTGKLRWYCQAPPNSSFCSSAIAKGDVVYAMEAGPGGGGGIAVRAGGNGDVTDSHVVWTGRQSNRIGTPILFADRIYSFSRGMATCFDAHSGEEVFRGRLQSSGVSPAGRGGRGQDYSSPVMADGKIYFTSRSGDIYVIEAADEFQQQAVNRVTSDAEDFSATPAISDGMLFIRSSEHLYCVAQSADQQVQRRLATEGRIDASTAVEDEADDDERGGRRGRGAGGRGPGGRFDPAAIFARRDANGDGKLYGDELDGPFADRLDQIDTDGDKALTLEEFQNGMRRAFGGGRGGRGGGRGRGGFGGDEQNDDGPQRPQRPPLEEAE